MVNLKSGHKGVQLGNRVFGGGVARLLVLDTGRTIGGLNGLEEFGGGLLLSGSGGQELGGPTGLVHEAGQFVTNFEPLLLVHVSWDVGQTLLGFRQDSLLSCGVFGTIGLVEGVTAGFTVDRVGGVKLGGLVTSVGSILRVTGSISNQPKDRETGRFTDGGIGSDGQKGGSSDRGTLDQGFTTRGGFLWGQRTTQKDQRLSERPCWWRLYKTLELVTRVRLMLSSRVGVWHADSMAVDRNTGG